MTMALNAKRKFGFVDGSILRPPPDADRALIAAWDCTNAVVSSWLLNCVSKDIAASVICADSAAAIWNDLRIKGF